MSTNAQVYPDGTTINRAAAQPDKTRWQERKDAKEAARTAPSPPQASAPLPDDVMAARNMEAAKQAGHGSTKLDASAWPIVHGSVGMRDATSEHQPTTDTMALYSSQVVEGNDMNMAQMVVRPHCPCRRQRTGHCGISLFYGVCMYRLCVPRAQPYDWTTTVSCRLTCSNLLYNYFRSKPFCILYSLPAYLSLIPQSAPHHPLE